MTAATPKVVTAFHEFTKLRQHPAEFNGYRRS